MDHSFKFHKKLTILLEPLEVESILGWCVACVLFLLLAMTYEGLKCLRLNLAEQRRASMSSPLHMCSCHHLLQTFLFVLEVVIGYIVMLAAMTFNVWLFVAVVVGSLLGWQLCRLFSKDHRMYPVPQNVDLKNDKDVAQKNGHSDPQTGQSLLPTSAREKKYYRRSIELLDTMETTI